MLVLRLILGVAKGPKTAELHHCLLGELLPNELPVHVNLLLSVLNSDAWGRELWDKEPEGQEEATL